MPMEPGTKLGPYEILGPIGAGGMGEVYRARDERLSRSVAVKVLPRSVVGDPDRLRRFEQEARAAGQLNHPNIVVVYDTGTHDGVPYVVEELLEGETLRQRMGGTPLPPRKAIDYARQIAEGLAAAHQKGIVHRDLKPENIFVTVNGRVKILDFGLAKLARPEGSASLFTEVPTQVETDAGTVLGTVGYMSPEQVRGQHADPRSDLFSLGVILYEMVAGRRAFQAASAVETMNAILSEEPPSIARASGELPAGLERIVEHCLEKRAEERFQSARDLAFQLEAISSPAVSHVGPRRSTRPGRSRTSRVALLLAAVAALVAAAFWAGRLWAPSTQEAVYSQLSFRQGRIFTARFTPDGETVVYAGAWEDDPVEMFLARPGSPESRALGLKSAEILSISASGEMAVLLDSHFTLGFMRSGTLARAPLAGGAPRPILEDVEDADWSPSGDGLAVVRSTGGRYRLEYPSGKPLYETDAWLSSIRFSRDGRYIAFLDHPSLGDNRGRVAIVDLDGNFKTLTEPFSSAAGLAWSPSGEEIWFTAGLTGNVGALRAVDLDGNQRIVDAAPANIQLHDVALNGRVLVTRDTWRRGIAGLAPGAAAERDLSWHDWSRPSDLSEDGEWMLFEEQGQGGGPGYSVYLRKTDGSPAIRLGSGSSLDLSPDGNWALTLPVDRGDRLIVLPRGPGESRTLELPGLNVFSAAWFPDGKRLMVLANEQGKPTTLYVMDSEEAVPRKISDLAMIYGAVISPDGKLMAASPQGRQPQLFPVEGGEPRPISGSRPNETLAGWSQDGRTIFVAPRDAKPARVDRIDLVSGERAVWKELAPADISGLIDVSYVAVSADTSAYIYSYRQCLSTLYLVEGLR